MAKSLLLSRSFDSSMGALVLCTPNHRNEYVYHMVLTSVTLSTIQASYAMQVSSTKLATPSPNLYFSSPLSSKLDADGQHFWRT